MANEFVPQMGDAAERAPADMAVAFAPTIGDNAPNSAPEPVLAQQRVDFEPDKFTAAILQHGKRLMWRRAMICTCRQAMTLQAKVTCTICAGTGVRYVDPYAIQGILQQHDSKTKIFEKFGTWIDGLAQLTVEPQHRLGFRDSLEMVDGLSSYYEAFIKGDRTGRRSKLPPGEDIGRYRIVEVMRAIARVRDHDIVLEKGVHYRLTEQGRFAWLSNAIPDGSLVSIRYDFHPVYLVLHMPHAIRDDIVGNRVPRPTHQPLPLQAGVQLDWMNDAAADKQLPESAPPTFTATTGEL